MIETKFDPSLPLRYALYARMSSERQNERSPEQQIDTCTGEIKRHAYSWRHVWTYIDRAISGRLKRKRLQFMRMIADIRTRKIKIDLIVVDTFERFGRAEDLEALRRELRDEYGVLIVTADTGFANPTSAVGRVHAAIESLRSTEDGRIKSHNVRRGKVDCVKLKRWPGGSPPFGYRLKTIMIEKNGRQEVDYSVLVPDPSSDWIMLKLFQLAADTSWGSTRLARNLNDDPTIPDEFKPFVEATVCRWLDDSIYIGTYEWGECCTDIVKDRRVIKKNAPEDIIRIQDYCEPIVPQELWNRVNEIREVRRARILGARVAATEPEKLIAPIAAGLALKFILSGLIRCGHCERAMTVMTSPVYVTKDGTAKRYVSYRCPGAGAAGCPNHCNVPESWLRDLVIDLLQRRLFAD
ncbi:MAG: recombinase family protein [Gemmataceae bacterium]